jgi:UDP:flavonoid glycosyltransferase YjiC (YdhE family)
MGRIVFAWELGGGLGHILYDLPLAKKLQERGHEVVCIMKNIIDAEKILGKHGIKVLQAPIWQVKVNKLENTFSYIEMLFNQGYLFNGALLSMVKAWKNLLEIVSPDLLIVDHAPTAIIAARVISMKAINYGPGFFIPPDQNPIPTIIPWVKTPEGLLEHSEKKLVTTINDVLKKLKTPTIKCFSDLLEVDENILATFAELDHYQNRGDAKYWGPVINQETGGAKPQWPQKTGTKKIFCYLKPNYPYFDEVLSALEQTDAVCIAYIPNLPSKIKKRSGSSNLFISEEPLNMEQVCRECDLIVCHAGHGTVAYSLLHGKPLLLLPEHNQLEQILLTRKVVKQKLGLVVLTRQQKKNFRGKLETLLIEPEFTIQAQNFALKYKDFDQKKQLEEIADRCDGIMGNSGN